MKRFLLFIVATTVLTCSPVFAANFVSQVVFTSASSASNKLRATPMRGKVIAKDEDKNVLQTFVWQANQTSNITYTKSYTFPLTQVLCLWIQVDQDTQATVNSETAYMLFPAGFNSEVCFK
jgi:hypothetical protein